MFCIEDISPSMIAEWIGSMNSIPVTALANNISAVKSFISYYNANIEEIFTKAHFRELKIIDIRAYKAAAEKSKTPNIPENFFNQMLSTAIKDMENEKEDTFYRGMSAMLIIASQTGLRTAELFALETGCVKPVTIFNGETAYYLEYKTWKRVRALSAASTEITYVNALTKKAYDILVDIYADKRKELNIEYLFLGSYGKRFKETYPLDPNAANQLIKHLFYHYNKYFPTLLNAPSEIDGLPSVGYFKKSSLKNKNQVYVIRPTFTQMRVHVCSTLYEKGVPLEYIEKFMSHLSSEMAAYYVRPKKSVQENIDIATQTLKEIVTKEVTPLGAEKSLVSKIDSFIKENNYKVEKDLDVICETLAKNIPIRIKTGGVCIKSSKFRECSKDAMTNEFYCAYGVCPNLYTFYYMIDVSYRQFKELKDSIRVNTSNGHIRQAQKEANMLHTVIKGKLEPQMIDLKEKLNQFGYEHIVGQHPELSDIIVNMPEIEKEMKEVLDEI